MTAPVHALRKPLHPRFVPFVCAASLLAAAALGDAGATRADAPATRPARLNPEDLVRDPLVWRAFRPLVLGVAGGDVDRAVAYLRRGTRILRKADGSLQKDAATERFQEAATASLRDFDLESFYELLPQPLGGFHRFGFAGHEAEDAYVVRASTKEADEVRPGSHRRELGHSSGVVRMRPVQTDDDPHYLLQWRGGVGLGDLRWASVLEGASDAIRLLDEGHKGDLPLVLQAADAYMRKSQPGLDAEDRRALALGWSSYPTVAEHLLSISRTEDVLAPEPVDGCTHVQSRTRWDEKRIGRRYPELASYMERMDDLVELAVRVQDARGRQLVAFEFGTERMETRIDAFVRDGAVVPSVKGKPQPETQADYSRMTAWLDLHFALRGLHVYIEKFRVDVRYRETPDGMTLSTRATRMPQVRVEGAAFGFVPTRVVNWFIPGDMEGLAKLFFRALLEGNDGRGVATVTRFARGGDGKATLDGSGGAELLDNDLIRFGISFASKRTLPDDDVEQEMRALSLAYRSAFEKDLERFAEYGRPVVREAWAAPTPTPPVE